MQGGWNYKYYKSVICINIDIMIEIEINNI